MLAAPLAAFAGLLAAAVMLASAAGASDAVNPSLEVTFFVNGAISVALSDGTPVGSSSGTPTVIPAGYYTVLLTGPAGCVELPVFTLKGAGENIVSNLQDGEVTSTGFNAYFAPNSTYTWTNASTPATTYTFTTSVTVQGTPPVTTTVSSSVPSTTVSSEDVVGSAMTPIRGTLTGVVSAAGKLTVVDKGKAIRALTPGRYTITVTDRSAKSGFVLEKASGQTLVSVTGAAFEGKHSAVVELTSGRWLLSPRPAAKAAASILVS